MKNINPIYEYGHAWVILRLMIEVFIFILNFAGDVNMSDIVNNRMLK